jgi:flagellar basal-body rod modification protein FlgD
MSIWATVENGSIVDTSASALSSTKESSSSDIDKEEFLNLLVAQMKYQDPLEPQSNTEYVTQLATFTQVESLENMSATMESMEADNLVGKTVVIRSSSTSGSTSDVSGVVDYVLKEGSNVYLSVNGGLYNLDDLYTVADTDYATALALADDFESTVDQLPDADHVSLSDEATFTAIRTAYDNLTSYQQNYIQTNCSDAWNKFVSAETALSAMLALQNLINTTGSANGSTDDSTQSEDTAAETVETVAETTDDATEETDTDTFSEAVSETVEETE